MLDLSKLVLYDRPSFTRVGILQGPLCKHSKNKWIVLTSTGYFELQKLRLK